MPRQFTLPGGQVLRTGPFSIGNYNFPSNWLDLATAGDLTHWGISFQDVVDPAPPPPTSWSVSRRTIIERLQAANKLAAAKTALGNSSVYQQERWYASQYFMNNDAALRTMLTGIGADPDAILAIEA